MEVGEHSDEHSNVIDATRDHEATLVRRLLRGWDRHTTHAQLRGTRVIHEPALIARDAVLILEAL